MKRIKLEIWFVIICIYILAAGCEINSVDKYELFKSIESTDLSGEHMNSVSLSTQEEVVLISFGEPEKVHEIANPKTKYLVYDDIEFGIENNEVFCYFFTGDKSTAKGISKGDSRDKVMETYGPKYYERTDTDSDIIGYLDKHHGINLEFSFHENNLVGTALIKIVNKK
jgi:hypothetical protein